MCSLGRPDLCAADLLVGNAANARSQSLNLRADEAVPVLDFLSSLTLGVAVALLDFAFELVAVPTDGGQIVVDKLALPLLDFAFYCFQSTSSHFQSM